MVPDVRWFNKQNFIVTEKKSWGITTNAGSDFSNFEMWMLGIIFRNCVSSIPRWDVWLPISASGLKGTRKAAG